MSLAGVIVAIVGALLGAGGITALFQIRALNRKLDAQATQLEAEASVSLGGGWAQMWATQHQDNNELRERLVVVEQAEAECRIRLAELERGQRKTVVEIEARVMKLLDEEIVKREVDRSVTT